MCAHCLQLLFFCFFFFSSRRRHTRLQGDWSSDVCSSDLAARAAHAQALLDSTLVLDSPDSVLDRAVRWAELNLDEALACNPDLGCGLVAGYGPSGPTSTRPGFAWYFGGDASINSFAMSSVGLWGVARDGLAFFATYQGKKAPNLGKIPHEISH